MLLVALPFLAMAQKSNDLEKYLAGAVPTNEQGVVYFEKTYNVKGKSQADLYRLLYTYTTENVIAGENHLPQARLLEANIETGELAASMEEYLYFKRTALVNDRVRFYYKLIFKIEDEKFTVSLQNLHYIYDDIPSPQDYRAEKWITDDVALDKTKTKLRKMTGKFRRFTIDRKDELFRGAAKAVGAVRLVTREVVEEED